MPFILPTLDICLGWDDSHFGSSSVLHKLSGGTSRSGPLTPTGLFIQEIQHLLLFTIYHAYCLCAGQNYTVTCFRGMTCAHLTVEMSLCWFWFWWRWCSVCDGPEDQRRLLKWEGNNYFVECCHSAISIFQSIRWILRLPISKLMKKYGGLVSIKTKDLSCFIFTLMPVCDVIAYPCVYLWRGKTAGIPHPRWDTGLKIQRGK